MIPIFFHSIALAALVGALVMMQAYVPRFTALVGWCRTLRRRSARQWRQELTVAADALARIMHHASRFCAPAWRAQAVDPSVWIGVRQLAVQRVWD